MSRATLLTGDALALLPTLDAGSVRCCITSPPYWGLRDYGVAGQLGLERTPEAYVERMVAVFREVRRVLRDDGTLWLNLGDSYGSVGGDTYSGFNERWSGTGGNGSKQNETLTGVRDRDRNAGLRPKNLVGIPWRVAFALQADGWYLRSDIIWAKPNPMPESVTDRPTKAHEYLFLLAKAERYYFDADAIEEPGVEPERKRLDRIGGSNGHTVRHSPGGMIGATATRNARSVWTIATQPYPDAHFATFPEELARRCIVAGSAAGDTVLDPFSGSGTVAAVAVGNGRHAIGVELNPDYHAMAERRVGPMFVGSAPGEGA